MPIKKAQLFLQYFLIIFRIFVKIYFIRQFWYLID